MFKLVILSAVLAVVAGNPNIWGAGLVAPWAPLSVGVSPYAPYGAAIGPVPPVGAPNYRGPLSLAPGQPANILGADGRPLDTLSVNLDRAVHYTARAVEANGRRLQKRSILAPVAAHVIGNYAGAHLADAYLAGGHLAAVPLTLGRSWVGPAPIAPVAAAVAGPLGF